MHIAPVPAQFMTPILSYADLERLEELLEPGIDVLVDRGDTSRADAPSGVHSDATGKPCAVGCEKRGNCNAETGVCDCPPHLAGPTCEQSSVPACQIQWSLSMDSAPCEEPMSPFGFPVTCDCLMQCHSLNVRPWLARDCVNASGASLLPAWANQQQQQQQQQAAPYSRAASSEAASSGADLRMTTNPRIDAFGDAKWIRQAYAPTIRDPTKRNASELWRLNSVLALRLSEDGKQSLRLGRCSSKGIYTTTLPWQASKLRIRTRAIICCCLLTSACVQISHFSQLSPAENAEELVGARKPRWRCYCFPGYSGFHCERGPSHPESNACGKASPLLESSTQFKPNPTQPNSRKGG